MRIRFYMIMFFRIFLSTAQAGGEFISMGGRSAGMANASISLSDGWAGFNNQAGLAWNRKFSAGMYYENRFLIKEIGIKAFSAVLPVKKGSFGISFSYFGFSLYNEMKSGLAYAMNFGNSFSAGVQIDYLRFHAGNDLGTKNLFTFEIGLQFRVKEQLCLGIHIYNPVAVTLTEDPRERLPAVFRTGLGWNITENFLVVAEIEKELLNDPALKAGMEYHFVKPLFIRIGYMTAPSQFTFGFGLEFGRFSIDIASSYNMILGFSPQGSINYQFK